MKNITNESTEDILDQLHLELQHTILLNVCQYLKLY